MAKPDGQGEKSVAMFLLGAVLLNPPLLGVFRADWFVFGVPLLYLYLFVAWGVLIALLALAMRQRGRAGPGRIEPPPNES